MMISHNNNNAALPYNDSLYKGISSVMRVHANTSTACKDYDAKYRYLTLNSAVFLHRKNKLNDENITYDL